jgi:hypothetical protein
MVDIKLEFMGNKPIISKRGIYFQPSKEDKYIYLQTAMHIVTALMKIDENDEKYVASIDGSKKFSNGEIISTVQNLRPNFEDFFSKHIDTYREKIELEEERVESLGNISEDDKMILEENYHIMHDYRIQRAKNKLVYEELINGAVELIRKFQIHTINLEFSREVYHIMQSLKTTIEWNKIANRTTISFLDNGLKLELNVGWI